jgi:hypothetical protein
MAPPTAIAMMPATMFMQTRLENPQRERLGHQLRAVLGKVDGRPSVDRKLADIGVHISAAADPRPLRYIGTSAPGLALENAQSDRAIRPGVGDA